MKILKISAFACLSLALFMLGSCKAKDGAFVPEGYSLVWSDEFDVDGAPNEDDWNYSIGA